MVVFDHFVPVLFPHSQADQPQTRGRFIFLRQQCHSANVCHNGQPLPGAP